MLTVKLYRTIKGRPLGEDSDFPAKRVIKIVETDEVDIYTLRPGELYEIAGTSHTGKSFAYYISDDRQPRPNGFADEIEFYYAAYVENSSGATTEAVTFP
jgi:hypothetical protein